MSLVSAALRQFALAVFVVASIIDREWVMAALFGAVLAFGLVMLGAKMQNGFTR